MTKLPAFQFYPGDWKKDPGIQALEFFERHVWFELLLLMHDSEERGVLVLNGKPMSYDAISRSLGLDKQILTTALTKILDYGVASLRQKDSAIYSRRMVKDEEIRKVRKIAGLQGGNPNLVKQKSTTQVKQILTPSSSSSSSSSSSDIINTQPPVSNHVPENIDPELWKNVIERLPTPTDPPQPWQMSNQWINAGRMPMLRYPDLWITSHELASAIKIFREKEVPTKLYKQIFEMAQANATTKKGNGINPDRYSAFLSITGWVLNEVLKQHNESVKITKNQENYANQRN